MEFDWDDANRIHLLRHTVSCAEAEEAINGQTYELDAYEVGGEVRFEELGETAGGRILFLVMTERGAKIRVVTAFDATRTMKETYLLFRSRSYE